MNISILSGKGGTGKTTISTNLSILLSENHENVSYFDFDVEEPNGFIFLKPEIEIENKVFKKVPKIDKELCTNCSECSKLCKFNAISITPNNSTVFEKLCHDCGLCYIACPVQAISEILREIGKIESGKSKDISNLNAFRGVLNIGEPSGVPVISALKKFLDVDSINILDAPPGSSCSVINTVEDSDYSILVTEPTKFGLHDLKIAVEVLRYLNIPFGVLINKSDEFDFIIENYCENEKIDILGKIPFSRNIANKYSKGNILINSNVEFTENLQNIASELEKRLIL
ncbi:MinD superfamily P-loop ATPase [Methanococcus maripaludis]|uniref:MinD superfamily P-loop ATPase n=1 Tax=Methanococcus maripaludis TaxID=39152 RepID=A0A7J9NV31_METMI|nr:ATP-binding protein [Methanococcus maripaludis]MBA2851529.1 MinD superfamily P-loop ATPase [Methanococcus maripaludis]